MDHSLIVGPAWLTKAVVLALVMQLAGTPLNAQTLPTAIQIVTVQGEGASGSIRQRPSEEPTVRVVDESGKPVAGAAVVFTLPTEGATGSFGNNSKTLTLVTDANGSATGQGLRFNQIPGKVPLHVNASYKGLTARTTITQISQAPEGYKPGGRGKVIAILGILAAAGAGGAYYALNQNKSTTPPAPTPPGPSPIGITTGVGTIAPPR